MWYPVRFHKFTKSCVLVEVFLLEPLKSSNRSRTTTEGTQIVFDIFPQYYFMDLPLMTRYRIFVSFKDWNILQ